MLRTWYYPHSQCFKFVTEDNSGKRDLSTHLPNTELFVTYFNLHLGKSLCHCNSVTNFFQGLMWSMQIKCLQLIQKMYFFTYFQQAFTLNYTKMSNTNMTIVLLTACQSKISDILHLCITIHCAKKSKMIQQASHQKCHDMRWYHQYQASSWSNITILRICHVSASETKENKKSTSRQPVTQLRTELSTFWTQVHSYTKTAMSQLQ